MTDMFEALNFKRNALETLKQGIQADLDETIARIDKKIKEADQTLVNERLLLSAIPNKLQLQYYICKWCGRKNVITEQRKKHLCPVCKGSGIKLSCERDSLYFLIER